MSKFSKPYQPGAILHEVIVGAFRASGTSFEAWCKRALLKRIIAAAGEEMVSAGYSKRMIAEASHLSEATDDAKASS